MAHFKRKKARTSGSSKSDYKSLARKLGGYEKMYHLYSGCPGHWNVIFHIRPLRRKGRVLEQKIMNGADPDEIVWPCGNHKPHVYYW